MNNGLDECHNLYIKQALPASYMHFHDIKRSTHIRFQLQSAALQYSSTLLCRRSFMYALCKMLRGILEYPAVGTTAHKAPGQGTDLSLSLLTSISLK